MSDIKKCCKIYIYMVYSHCTNIETSESRATCSHIYCFEKSIKEVLFYDKNHQKKIVLFTLKICVNKMQPVHFGQAVILIIRVCE